MGGLTLCYRPLIHASLFVLAVMPAQAQQPDAVPQSQAPPPLPTNTEKAAFISGFIYFEAGQVRWFWTHPEENLLNAATEFQVAGKVPAPPGKPMMLRMYGMKFQAYAPHSFLTRTYTELHQCEQAKESMKIADRDPPDERDTASRALKNCKPPK
jgi:hypothetical protein